MQAEIEESRREMGSRMESNDSTATFSAAVYVDNLSMASAETHRGGGGLGSHPSGMHSSWLTPHSRLDSDGAPDLNVAREYRLEQLPRRIHEDGTMQGYRRNRPGELVDPVTNDPAELYPVFDGELYSDLDSFGLGISLYYRQLLFFLLTILVASIILIASISHNAAKCRHSVTGNDEKNKELVIGSAAGCLPSDLKIGANVVPDVMLCVVILLATLAANFLERLIETRIDEAMQTPSDYSIVVSNPPDYIDDPDRYRDFFASFFGEGDDAAKEDIVCVTISKDNGAFLQLLAQRRAYQQDLEDFEAQQRRGDRAKFDDATLPWYARLLQPFTYDYGLFKTRGFAEAQLEDVETKLGALIEGGSASWRLPKRVHVTFASEEAQHRALKAYQVSALRRLIGNATGYESEEMPRCFDGGTILNVGKPVEPTEILWHNSHVKLVERLLRLALSILITGSVLAVVCVVAAVLRGSWKFTLSIFITAVNAGLPPFIKILSESVERHIDFGDAQDSMFLKLIAARWVNTAIAVYVSYSRRDRLSNEALTQVMLILLFDAFLNPLIRAFDVYDQFMRYWVSPLQATQRAMNRFWIGAEWNIAERYTDVSKTVFVGLFYAAALPAAPLVTAAAMITTFCADRYLLLRRWRRIPELDAQLAQRTIGIVAIVVFFHFWASMAFFLNWGEYSDLDDDVQDDRTDRQINCFRGLLNCGVQGKNLTRAQRFVYRVYRPLGYVAFAAALWKFAGVELKRALRAFFCGKGKDGPEPQYVSFRHLTNVGAYVPVVEHDALDDALIAAVVVDVPTQFLPISPDADAAALCLATPEEIGPLLTPDCRGSRIDVLNRINSLFGVVKFYPPPSRPLSGPTNDHPLQSRHEDNNNNNSNYPVPVATVQHELPPADHSFPVATVQHHIL